MGLGLTHQQNDVHPVTGEAITVSEDAYLLGFSNFIFSRNYRTSAVERKSDFGYGWSHFFNQYFNIDNNFLHWRDHEGIKQVLKLPNNNIQRYMNFLGGCEVSLGFEEDTYIVHSERMNGFYGLIKKINGQWRITELLDHEDYEQANRSCGLCTRSRN